MEPINITVFASGNGTNCENLIRHFEHSAVARVSLVVCNKQEAKVVERAQSLGVPVRIVSGAQLRDSDFVLPMLKDAGTGLIVLAGFLLFIPHYLVEAYSGRMINIHPALLPKFGGKGMYGHHVHEAVWAAHEKETGFTVHYVSDECDSGSIIAQEKTALTPDDTPDDIDQKEHRLEMEFFPGIVERVAKQIKEENEKI